MSSWPKLSETLPHHTPGKCQSCNMGDSSPVFEAVYWQECDDQDQKTRQFIMLCQDCSDEIIEPHPRLYHEVSDVTPMPGAMPICLDCIHRDKMLCQCPKAQFMGGPGLEYEPKGSMAHVCRSPRSKSGWVYMAPGPVTACSGKEGAESCQKSNHISDG